MRQTHINDTSQAGFAPHFSKDIDIKNDAAFADNGAGVSIGSSVK